MELQRKCQASLKDNSMFSLMKWMFHDKIINMLNLHQVVSHTCRWHANDFIPETPCGRVKGFISTNLSNAMEGTEPKEQQRTEEWCLEHWIKHTWHPTIDQEVERKQWVCKTQNKNNTITITIWYTLSYWSKMRSVFGLKMIEFKVLPLANTEQFSEQKS